MADSPTTNTTGTANNNSPSFALQAAQGQLVQIIGKLADSSGSQSADVITALNGIAAAINAKPSA